MIPSDDLNGTSDNGNAEVIDSGQSQVPPANKAQIGSKAQIGVKVSAESDSIAATEEET